MTALETPQLTTALDWYRTMPAPVHAVSDGVFSNLSIRRYCDSPPEMRQPALCENLICLHQGGAKEVRRWHAGRKDVYTVELGALTIMPAKASNRWVTRGPIDFTHLTLSSSLLGRVALEEFGHDPEATELLDSVGVRDPFLESLFSALVNAVDNRAGVGRLYPESLLTVFVVTLLTRYSRRFEGRNSGASTSIFSKGGLTPFKLQCVVDYMNEHLASDIGLDELTSVAGISRAQFFRAFKQSTGVTPHRFLTDLRLDTARTMLDDRGPALSDVAAASGIPNPQTFSALFRRRFGTTPKAYWRTK